MTKPKINPSLATTDYIIEAVGAISFLYMIAQLIVEYPEINDQVAIYFNSSGKADDWGDKSTLLILPIVTISLYVGMTVLTRYPYVFNYPVQITEENATKQYQLAKSLIIMLKAGIAGIFAFIQYQTIRISSGDAEGLGSFFIIVVMLVSSSPIVLYIILARRHK